MVSKTIMVKCSEGIHLRPAGTICEAAYRMNSKVYFLFEDRKIDAKSVLSVLSAGIGEGDSVTIVCEGSDEQMALDSIVKIIEEL